MREKYGYTLYIEIGKKSGELIIYVEKRASQRDEWREKQRDHFA